MARFAPWILLVAAVVAAAAFGRDPRLNVLVPHGERELVVMDFSRPFTLEPPPAGWVHRRFWTRRPMQMSFIDKDGVPALRLSTQSSASMLFRHVDVPVDDYPILAWHWFVERPIESTVDEKTREGDDHPARLFLAFQTASGEGRRMEIIWGNTLHAGDYKFIGTFPHYVANGGAENIGRWHSETVDLRPIYRRLWPDGAPAHLVDIALFCDSDETHGETVAYFADVRLIRP
jgi:hypothetical protein